MNYLTLILSLMLISYSKEQKKNEIDGLIIDPSIKSEIENHIVDQPEFKSFSELMQVYENSLCLESYENENLVVSTTDFTRKLPFKSFYLWNNDIIGINGAYGLFGGTGFYIKIANKKAELFHMLSSDDFPTYLYKETDSLIMRLEIPCSDTKIILSEIPDSTKNQLIYGLVEFKSNNFYSAYGAFREGEEPKKKRQETI